MSVGFFMEVGMIAPRESWNSGTMEFKAIGKVGIHCITHYSSIPAPQYSIFPAGGTK
jgi:hypothetical protein